MRDIPECLNRRYKALDELIKELGTYGASSADLDGSSDDPEIKLMCEFWNILKEDPGVNLKQAVQQRMGLNAISSGLFGQNLGCYMAGCCKKDNNNTKKDETLIKIKNLCCKGSNEISNTNPPTKISVPKTSLPLNKVLCNLKEAASYEKKCQVKVNELLENQKQLQDQILILEQREKDGMQLLKQADCMWSCMEETYKRKIAESLERQQVLLKQFKEVEASNKKWRNNKKDLEFEMDNITKCHQEIIEQINHKSNDVKCIDLEITNFKNRIDSDKKDIELALKSLTNKKQVSDGKIATMGSEITKLEKALIEEDKYKATKEDEGRKYVKDARDDLQKLCKVLLQKKLENEDMKAEREALILEFEMLKQTCDQCREKCKIKQESIIDEIKGIEKEIAEFKFRCIRCHECTDTMDVRKLCTDCPRCLNEQECLQEEGHCSPDHTMDCVCMTIKEKFLDNVFENMYTLLERQVKTGQGNAVAEAVVNCLKKSRNGKINDETKKLLQEFILTTVKKNLKLTIVGGAVKTRCEMDPETYKQLMLCLKEVKVTKPSKVDQGTDSKKDPCKRWGGSSECHCPKGPKACVCIGKGLLPSSEAQTCPPQVEDKEDAGEVIVCPHRDNAPCGADCAARAGVGSEVAAFRPSPCQGPTCNFKNMRAAQCVLGPEVLSTVSGPGCISPYIKTTHPLSNQATCKCSGSPKIPCTCHEDLRSQPRERIIQEVMGRFTDVTPIEKVVSTDGNIRKLNEEKSLKNERFGEMSLSNQNNLPNTSRDKSFQYHNCSFHSLISTDDENYIENKNRIVNKKNEKVKTVFNNLRKTSNENDFTKNKTNKLSREINVLRDASNEDIITSNLNKSIEKYPQENICKEVNKLMREVIIFNDDVKLNVRTNWISLTSFVNEVISLTNLSPDESNVTVQEELLNEILCSTESLNQDNISIFIDNDSKQLKAGIGDICDKNNCATISKPVDSRGKNQDTDKHITFEKMLVKQNNKDLKTKRLSVMCEKKNRLADTPKILKTSSGDLRLTLNQKLLEVFNKKMEKNCKLCTKLKNTNAGEDFGDLLTDPNDSKTTISDRKPKVLAKKSPSGNILLEVRKSLLNNQDKASINLSSSEMHNDTKTYKKDTRTPSEILKLKVIGAHCNGKEPLFALKATSSGNFEMVLDKEYEKSYKQTIKDYEGQDIEQFMPLAKTNSGNFIINLENGNENQLASKSALIVKSESGNIKVIMSEGDSEPLRKNSISKSIISPQNFNDLLNKLPISSRQLRRENFKKAFLRTERSSSDSHIYGKTKFYSQNEQNFYSEQIPVLKKTSSGEYAVILNKNSKKSFVNNLKSYLTTSSKGLVPIKRTDSGNIYVDLSNNAHSLKNYGSVKITPSGNIYITFDEQRAFPSNNINKNRQYVKIYTKIPLSSTNKSSPSKEIATICNHRDFNNLNQCNRKNICFKSKKWCSEQSKDGSSETHPCGQKTLNTKHDLKPSSCYGYEHRKSKSKCLHNLENLIVKNKSPHIVIKPCGCRPMLEKNSKKDSLIQSICPHHIKRYEKISNEILEISGLCSGSKNVNEANPVHIKRDNNVLHVDDNIKKQALDWDSLEYLPPQLPSFLRDF